MRGIVLTISNEQPVIFRAHMNRLASQIFRDRRKSETVACPWEPSPGSLGIPTRRVGESPKKQKSEDNSQDLD